MPAPAVSPFHPTAGSCRSPQTVPPGVAEEQVQFVQIGVTRAQACVVVELVGA